MRIIGGKFKGRRFYPPAKNWPTRPTTDYAKEGLFNILNNSFYFDEMKVLDLFGGTGNHSYEFISRGCKDVTYVDNFAACVRFVTEIAEKLNISSELKIVRADVFKFIDFAAEPYDYIFAGPPYALGNIDALPELIFSKKLLKPNGWFVLETNDKYNFSNRPHFHDVRNYGKTVFTIFKLNAENPSIAEQNPLATETEL